MRACERVGRISAGPLQPLSISQRCCVFCYLCGVLDVVEIPKGTFSHRSNHIRQELGSESSSMCSLVLECNIEREIVPLHMWAEVSCPAGILCINTEMRLL